MNEIEIDELMQKVTDDLLHLSYLVERTRIRLKDDLKELDSLHTKILNNNNRVWAKYRESTHYE